MGSFTAGKLALGVVEVKCCDFLMLIFLLEGCFFCPLLFYYFFYFYATPFFSFSLSATSSPL